MNLESNSTRSYATRKRLELALDVAGLDKCKPIICRTPAGRWTAIFGYSLSGHWNPASIARHGFMVIN